MFEYSVLLYLHNVCACVCVCVCVCVRTGMCKHIPQDE